MTLLILEPSDQMSPPARAAEIAAILARSILRQHTDREPPVVLGFSPGKRVHTTPSQPEKKV